MKLSLFPAPDETILGAGEGLRLGRYSSTELVRKCLDRIAEIEAGVRAWVLVDRDGAMLQAAERDSEAQAGRWRGPLHGIPIAIKDIYDVAGFPTAAGSALLARNTVSEDCTVVKRLREAGAIIVGKTVTTQFASFDPSVTTNPWDASRTPGGSSSGSAAAVATGMCLAAMASQTGGSITRPASFCGVAGCKPSYGLVSLQGILPLAPSMDHPGPMARTVRDLAVMLDAIAGPDPLDPISLPFEYAPVGPALAKPFSPPNLGWVRGHYEELADGVMVMALREALDAFSQSGAKVAEVRLPSSHAGVVQSHRILMACEAAAWHEQRLAAHPEDYQPCIRSLLEEGLKIKGTDYFRARQHQDRLTRDMVDCLNQVDALVMPATVGPAPDRGTTGDPAFNSPWSFTGLPVISFPIKLSADGLPLCIQIVGRNLGEGDLFRAAAWCEDAVRKTLTG